MSIVQEASKEPSLYKKKLMERRRRRRRLRNRVCLDNIPEECRKSYIQQKRTEREKAREEMHKHLDECLQRRNESECYRFCFNCSFTGCMSSKEKSSLMRQLSYAYSSLKNTTDIKIQYHITSLESMLENSDCCSKYDVFSWKVCRHNAPYWEVYDHKQIVVLSPDAETDLDHIDTSFIYVIGGLVDRTIAKGESYAQAKHANLTLRRLPLKAYGMTLVSPVLNINTVVSILIEYIRTNNWKKSFMMHLPLRRCGTAGPRSARKQRFRLKAAQYEEMERLVLDAFYRLHTPQTHLHDSATALQHPHVEIQLDTGTLHALQQLDTILRSKRTKQERALSKTNIPKKNRLSTLTAITVPETVPESGHIPLSLFQQWVRLLESLRNQRVHDHNKNKRAYFTHAWWENNDDQAAEGQVFSDLFYL